MTKRRNENQAKSEALREEGSLNPHPEAVKDPLFREGEFFDPRDLVQVKYEMLRRVRVERHSVTRATLEFGLSRPTFYEARAAFDRKGLPGVIPKRRGPRGPHKLRPEVLEYLQAQVVPGEPIRARAVARQLEERFGIVVHPRSIERALSRREKKPR